MCTWYRQPAIHLRQTSAPSDSRHGRGQSILIRSRVVHVVGGDQRQTGVRRQRRQGVVCHRIGRQSEISDLDRDMITTEQSDQVVQLSCSRARPLCGECQPDMTFPATGQDHPRAGAALGQFLQVVKRSPLLIAAQLCLSDRRGKPVVALDTTSQNEQVLPLRIGDAVLGNCQAERELGAVNGFEVICQRCFGNPGRCVEAVMVGDCQPGQA